tara:strand:+ start:21110 stop:21553 length:444 start_codon:yes stop_codon:yes gene_type:complete
MDNQEPIRIETNLNTTIYKVWEALTNVTQMRKWYFENIPDFKPEEGFETKFEVKSGERIFTHIWKITEVIPIKKISYTWKFEEYSGEGLSIFQLSTENNTTHLKLESRVLKPYPKDIPEFKRESGEAGWNYLINKNLVEFLQKSKNF